jgi:hypothetical protein
VSNRKIMNPEKWGSKMLSIIPICNRYDKYGRGYCKLAHAEKKPLSVSQNAPWLSWKSPGR